LCPAPSRACAGLHPSRQFAVRGMRFPSPSSIEYCLPAFEPRLEILPATGCLDPKAALPRHPPALSLANSCSYPSTVAAELLPVDRWKRRAFAPEAGPDIMQLARRENPTPAVQV